LEKEIWNMFFIVGILIGGVIAFHFLSNPNPIIINDDLRTELATYGITNIDGMLPSEIFSWENLFTIKGFLMMVVGGFMIGFGSRYAGGCTAVTHFGFVKSASTITNCYLLLFVRTHNGQFYSAVHTFTLKRI
jgi:uncharacterized membrane protein YedE/YeeE